ncbi:GerAB/ArcD/ProY family transporter [Paenibacillus sp. N3/727]|uniref:GerAB/ArcD/ProY family transporter n=1 Tax=Paenibacillus sp. N3/727 TaxID=2925845 RepID=UPI001F53644F|nr:GerAB/ArcD/ProY family transporter [Paenibacillus sp. N3/727]UNK18970.1 GerAB/ArcD/ProY family transporter [Paenibacillus sp. N3/727]
MHRYQYYLVLLCTLISPVLYVPRLLLEARYSGAMTAVGIAILIGILINYLFKRSLQPFQELSLTEILEQYVPSSIRFFLFSLFGLTWFAAGASVLISISFVIKGFINPTMDIYVLLLCFLIAGCWAALRTTMTILYNLELWLLISIPLILFIWLKTIRNETFSWDAVLTMNDYLLNAPSWDLIAVSSFLFTGYISLSICPVNHHSKRNFHWLWLIPLIGTVVFSATFFIPIGIHGTQAVDKYVYIWVNTADSIQIKHGVIERGVFLHLISYIIMSLLFISTSWHVATEWMSGAIKHHSAHVKRILVGIVGIIVFVVGYYASEKQVMTLTSSWFSIRFIAELLLVVVMLGVRRRVRCE